MCSCKEWLAFLGLDDVGGSYSRGDMRLRHDTSVESPTDIGHSAEMCVYTFRNACTYPLELEGLMRPARVGMEWTCIANLVNGPNLLGELTNSTDRFRVSPHLVRIGRGRSLFLFHV